ncbi:hypothetical protein Tco_0748311 [Tanacetum coccineum]|uniref:Uncharacterized protein n=1 Tax=Tanacetum coccineum TaxID=301880 RepID=A0ABQ4YW69_9ASTR
MASQDARLSKFEADFKQQHSEMTNKIDTVLKAIIDRIVGALPSDTVMNLKLNTSPVLSARSYPTEDPQCLTYIHGSINAVTIHPKQQSDSYDNEPAESEEEEKDSPENTNTNPSASPDPSVSFITKKVIFDEKKLGSRKAHVLEDKQIPSVGVFDEVFLALGWHLEEIHVTWAHLEKKRTRLRTYTKSLEDLCIQRVETAS